MSIEFRSRIEFCERKAIHFAPFSFVRAYCLSEMCSQQQTEVYETVFRECLKDFRVLEGGKISGYCDSAEEIEQLLNTLKSLGFMYSVRRSKHSQGCTDGKKSFFFQQLHGNVHINFFGPAFSVESTCQRQCTLGPKYYKKKESAVADHLEDHVNPRKKRLLIMDTKKSDCPAILDVKQVKVYPDYTIHSLNEHWETRAKVIERLRNDFMLPNRLNSYIRFYLVASPANHHTHSTECVKASGNIHPLLVKEIQNLVQNGTTSLKVIKLALNTFVNNFTDKHTPDKMNTTFYPQDRTIYNHIYRALYGIRKPVFDQDTLQNQVTEWCKESDTKIFFRPYTDVDGEVHPLLFCYQNNWQTELLNKYGYSCLLDATYKTTKYDIPLFFITVKSNVGYLVIGFFFIQVENTSSIHEALEIFKGWNKDWNPTYWVTDFSESEISAIMQTFPQTKVYLCAFHREQAWLRWLRKRGNLAVPDDSGSLLHLWRNIAESPTVELYSVRIQELRNHAVAHRNPGAMVYFQNQWLSESCKWVKAFEDKGIFDTINTTNGVETMNKMVKHFFLKHSTDRTLTGVIKILKDSFLPSLIKKYCLKNSAIKSYNKDVPVFLHKKTQKFVRHVMKRYSSAEIEFNKRSVTVIDEGLFCVESSISKECHYIVNFFEPNCTCEDFQRHKYPCKHFCAIFIFHPDWGFDQMKESYRNSPSICLDETYGFGLSRTCSEHTWAVPSSQEISSNEETDVEHDVPETPSCRSQQLEARELCKRITNLTYNCSNSEELEEVLGLLRTCVIRLETSNPAIDGLPLAEPSSSKQ